MTAWEDAAAMNAFRVVGAHRGAMPKLLDWCDEASIVRWDQETSELPPWLEVHRRMVKDGRPLLNLRITSQFHGGATSNRYLNLREDLSATFLPSYRQQQIHYCYRTETTLPRINSTL
jgi:hypothetical protein